MLACGCAAMHERRRVVLTGGPGAGKTAVLELIRQSFCKHVKVLQEAAVSFSEVAFHARKTLVQAGGTRAIFSFKASCHPLSDHCEGPLCGWFNEII